MSRWVSCCAITFLFFFSPAFAESDSAQIKEEASKAPSKQTKLVQNNLLKIGEKLHFDISWGWITAGKAKMFLLPEANQSKDFKFNIYVRDTFLSAFFPVRDTITTSMDGETMLPKHFLKITNEGSYHQRVHIDFDRKNNLANLADTVFKEEDDLFKPKKSSDTTVTIDMESHSITSAFLMFRHLDLEPGKEFKFSAVSGKKKYELLVKCHKIETIKVPAGKFKCFKVEPLIDSSDGIMNAKGKMTIWITTDERRIPVLMKSKVAIGSIDAELTRVEYQ